MPGKRLLMLLMLSMPTMKTCGRALDTDSDHGLLVIAVPCNDETVPVHGCGDHIVRKPGTFPDLTTVPDIITADALGGTDDDLCARGALDDEGC